MKRGLSFFFFQRLSGTCKRGFPDRICYGTEACARLNSKFTMNWLAKASW